MKVFVSSLIAGMVPFRQAARDAVETLRHSPIMAEDFGAQPNSPQVACLTELRQSDVMVLILGESYGAEQPSGMSATHEEYRDAQERKPVIAFVQEGVTREPRQAAFVDEVQGWEGGLFRGGFKDERDLQKSITRALHDFEMANAVGPVDEADLVKRSVALLPADQRNGFYGGSPSLALSVAGGPTQEILRPVEIEDRGLWESLHRDAMFGSTAVFDQSKGVQKGLDASILVLQQDRDGAQVRLDEQAGILIRTPIKDVSERGDQRGFNSGLPVLLEELVHQSLASALAYTAAVLERVDPTQRLTHVAVAARIIGGDGLTWRTRAEHAQSPNSVSMVSYGASEKPPVYVSKRRAALRLDVGRLVEDLLVPLRRHWSR